MKLRNKKTGEIAEPFGINCINGRTFVQFDDGKGTFKFEARSLAELNEEWEDYEESEFWYVEAWGKISKFNLKNDLIIIPSRLEAIKEIGNYFETNEEAEKAVEKLEAWKRLKDKGFRFSGFAYTELCDYARINVQATMINDGINDDLDLLFGGEK